MSITASEVALFINSVHVDSAGNESTGWWDVNAPFVGAGGRITGWGRIGGKYTLLGMTDPWPGAINL